MNSSNEFWLCVGLASSVAFAALLAGEQYTVALVVLCLYAVALKEIQPDWRLRRAIQRWWRSA